MKLSTKGRYGMKAMIDIAVFGNNQYISLKSVAQRQNLSETYLEQLIAPLRKAGLVKSARGAQGGYTLGKPPGSISAGEIVKALEGSIAPVECIDNADVSCGDTGCGCCASKRVWEKLHDAMNQALDGISLEELAETYKELNDVEELFS